MACLENEASVSWLTMEHNLLQSIIDLELIKCIDPEIVLQESFDLLQSNYTALNGLLNACVELENEYSSKATFSVMIMCETHIKNTGELLHFLEIYKMERATDQLEARLRYFKAIHCMESCSKYHFSALGNDIVSLNDAVVACDKIDFYWFALNKNESQACVKDILKYTSLIYGTHFIVPPFLLLPKENCSECFTSNVLLLKHEKGHKICNHLAYFGVDRTDGYDEVASSLRQSPLESIMEESEINSEDNYWRILQKGNGTVSEEASLERDENLIVKAIKVIKGLRDRKQEVLPGWKDLVDCFPVNSLPIDEDYVGYFGMSPRNNIHNRTDRLSIKIYSTYNTELKELRKAKHDNTRHDVRSTVDVEGLLDLPSNGDEITDIVEGLKSLSSRSCYEEASNCMAEVKEKQILKKIDNASHIIGETYNDMVQTMFPAVTGSLLLDRCYYLYLANRTELNFRRILKEQNVINLDIGNLLTDEANRMKEVLGQINLEDFTRAKISEHIKYFLLGPFNSVSRVVPIRDGIYLHAVWSALKISPDKKLKMKLFCSLEDSTALKKAKTFKQVFATCFYNCRSGGSLPERYDRNLHNIRFLVAAVYSFNEYTTQNIKIHKVITGSGEKNFKSGLYLLNESDILMVSEINGLLQYHSSSDIFKLLYKWVNQP